jgi:hypothetical protein
MVSNTQLENEVFTGVGAGATLIPEMDIYLGDNCSASSATLTIDSEYTDGTKATLALVPELYIGCVAHLRDDGGSDTLTLVVKDNTATTLVFDETITGLGTTGIEARIISFGAPAPAPKVDTNEFALLSDNWLGLVNTITPPSVEVEIAQLNLAVAGDRNFQYQYKKNETLSGGSMDVSIGNGMWLYYALGHLTVDATSSAHTTPGSAGAFGSGDGVAIDESENVIVRVLGGELYPPLPADDTADRGNIGEDDFKLITEASGGYYDYDFTEANGSTLPSFALDVSYEKAGLDTTNDYYVGSKGTTGSEGSAGAFTNQPYNDIYSRIFTGCQLNSLTLNFEEGQELKGSLDFVSRRAFDTPVGFAPKRKQRTTSDLFNFATSSDAHLSTNAAADLENQPYLFSGGSIKLYGQTLAKVVSGSIAINNNIQPQRFVGNYNREITSQHIAGQRTYDINLTMLISDTRLWENLRADGEHSGATGPGSSFPNDGRLEFKFSKADNDYIELKFEDYITQAVNVPFPDDKGPLQVEATFSARTLADAKYRGNWVILHSQTGV